MPSGYSATQLAKKLGLKTGYTVAVINEPDDLRELLVDLPEDVNFDRSLDGQPDVVIAFYTDVAALDADLERLGAAIFPDRSLWLAWPKKTSKVSTDLSGDVVRATVLATKMVDVKVCAISDTWSGLKVLCRKEHRAVR